MTPPACPTSNQNNWQTCTSGDPDCQLKKNTGYIQNMFHCLNIKNLQYNFLMFFYLFFPIGGGWVKPQLENSNYIFSFFLSLPLSKWIRRWKKTNIAVKSGHYGCLPSRLQRDLGSAYILQYLSTLISFRFTHSKCIWT